MTLESQIKKLQQVYKNKQIINGQHEQAEIFNTIFREIFLHSNPSYTIKNDKEGASRSNWTYHTALSMKQAADIMNYNCYFEVEGKRDGVIRTKGKKPQDILVAEWEWDSKDIFGKGKELEKLNSTTNKSKTSSAFLFTYVETDKFDDFAKRVIEYWQSNNSNNSSPPLYLNAILYSGGSFRNFEVYRIYEIYNDSIIVWNDYLF